jgi:hypothetical protein
MARCLAAVVIAVMGAAGVPAGADPVPVPSVVAAGPGGFAAGFATPVVVSLQGQGLTFLNVDLADHDVVSRATTLKRVKVGKRWKTVRVPLFRSAQIGTGATADVVGVRSLRPATYAFVCSIHAATMTGQLQVQPAP